MLGKPPQTQLSTTFFNSNPENNYLITWKLKKNISFFPQQEENGFSQTQAQAMIFCRAIIMNHYHFVPNQIALISLSLSSLIVSQKGINFFSRHFKAIRAHRRDLNLPSGSKTSILIFYFPLVEEHLGTSQEDVDTLPLPAMINLRSQFRHTEILQQNKSEPHHILS